MGAFFENFFKVNWITLLVGGLILAGLIVLQNKSDFISKHLQVKPMRFYITVLLFVLFIAVLNYLAVVVFGTWRSMIISMVVIFVSGAGLMWFVTGKQKK